MEYQDFPDINGWAALRAIVEQGGVSAAAVALNIGQPAVTKRLRALEASYGTRLMERVSGRLRLTPAGEKVYLLAVQTLDRQRALYEELQNLYLGQSTLGLEVTFSIGEHLLPDLLFQFADRYPDYKIDSRMAYGRDIQSHLVTGRTDLALMENAPDHPDVLVQKWADDELWLVCGASHPLARSEWLAVEQLTELPYVLREKHASSREELDQALTGIGIEKLDVALEVGSTDTIVEMLGRGKHVSFLPRFAVK
ncbi:MAG: LysR family transcriptional regulator, partial [Thiohalophilus sp.]|uniref:LysR family transcriptional regulator n=1 Tax=Thiohalophilus sp. TaxID=3028392 RepID=UPI00286FD6D3